MKKNAVVAALIGSTILGSGILGYNALAQSSASKPPAAIEDVYVVKQADNLWQLSEARLHDATLWQEVVAENPQLGTPSRTIHRHGKTIVKIYPGEKLYGLHELGVLSPAPQATVSAPLVPMPFSLRSWVVDHWPWELLAALVAAALAGLIVGRYLRRPVSPDDRPIVAGGVEDDTVQRHFREVGVRTLGHQDFTILEQEAGHISGLVRVRFNDGTEEHRVLDRAAAYRAIVQLPDGRQERLYMLQACGNDLRSGNIFRYFPGEGFTFTAHREVRVAPEPAPDAPEAEAPPVEVAPVAPAEEGLAEGEIQISYARGNSENGHMVRVQGRELDTLHCTVKSDSLHIRFQEVQKDPGKADGETAAAPELQPA